MNAPAVKQTTILCTASGEPPLGVGGLAFRDDQGEVFEHDNPRLRSAVTKIGVLELDNGTWLANPPGYRIDVPMVFPSRDDALAYAVDEVVRRAQQYMRNGEGEGTHWSEGFGNPIIDWALSLKSDDAPGTQSAHGWTNDGHAESSPQPIPESWADTITDKMVNEELTIAGYVASDAGAGLSDPVVRYLVEQHALRKQFPAKHIFSMTTEVSEGRVVSVATCTCKQVFRFGSNDLLRMNAAIEAHWRRFPHEKTVDGRGQPIGAEAPAPAKKRKSKKSPTGAEPSPAPAPASGALATPHDAGATPSATEDVPPTLRPEPALSQAPTLSPEGAGSILCDDKCAACEPLPAAGIDSYLNSHFIRLAIALAWRDPEAPRP